MFVIDLCDLKIEKSMKKEVPVLEVTVDLFKGHALYRRRSRIKIQDLARYVFLVCRSGTPDIATDPSTNDEYGFRKTVAMVTQTW